MAAAVGKSRRHAADGHRAARIEKVEQISLEKLTRREALSAGYEDLKSLQDELTSDRPSTLYRINFRLAGADPRIKLRANDLLSADDLE